MSGVAQAVIDQIIRLHHHQLESSGGRTNTREDITLLIREFGVESSKITEELADLAHSLGRQGSSTDKHTGDAFKDAKTLTRSSARWDIETVHYIAGITAPLIKCALVLRTVSDVSVKHRLFIEIV